MTARAPLPDNLALDVHHATRDLSDRIALGITRGHGFAEQLRRASRSQLQHA